MSRPPDPRSCGTRPKATGNCPKPTGDGETLVDLIHEYKRLYGDHQRANRDQYREVENLTEAIRYATGSMGKVPDHQRRVGRSILTQACDRLLLHTDEIQACESFAELCEVIESRTAAIRHFGRLAVYDTACRLGTYLGLVPNVVHLHAGTAAGAKALGLDTSRAYLEMDDLPEPFRLLEPWECEDFLCIYKARFANIERAK